MISMNAKINLARSIVARPSVHSILRLVLMSVVIQLAKIYGLTTNVTANQAMEEILMIDVMTSTSVFQIDSRTTLVTRKLLVTIDSVKITFVFAILHSGKVMVRHAQMLMNARTPP
jgi:hypothetical protein